MRFSERTGNKPARIEIQLDNIDEPLRNSLWSTIIRTALRQDHSHDRSWRFVESEIKNFSRLAYVNFFKWPIDKIPYEVQATVDVFRKWFFAAKWFEVYDFIEACVEILSICERTSDRDLLVAMTNDHLISELSGQRFVGEHFAAITNELELEAVENPTQLRKGFAAVSEHIQSAIRLYSDRTSPDYRNSIKESISAVEAAARVISGNEKATLPQAINAVDKKHPIHAALKEGLSKIYGYTSDEGGIRHSMLDEGSTVDQPDAYFMLVSCSAFCNYLIERYNRLS